jgi:hypothetical protein
MSFVPDEVIGHGLQRTPAANLAANRYMGKQKNMS